MRSLFFGLVMAVAVTGLAAPASRAAQSDEATAQRIAHELKESGRLKDYRVGVKYKEGVAWLLGTVASAEQKQTAEQIAADCEGVVHVVSKLEIDEAPTPESPVQTASPVPSARADTLVSVQPHEQARPLPAQGKNMPVPYARMGQAVQAASYAQQAQYGAATTGPAPMGHVPAAIGQSVSYDNPQMPGYAWPSYAAAPNYAALTYPRQYSASAWPYIGPFYPYPQVPLGWRKVTLEWDDGWWFLDFKDDCKGSCR
jgi:hypothetical protein